MLNKIKTSAKLYLLLFIMSVFIVGIGAYGINKIKTLNQLTKTIYDDRVFPIEQLSAIRFSYAEGILSSGQKVRTNQLTYKQALNQLGDAKKSIDTNWQAYQLTYLTPQENHLAKQASYLMMQADTTVKKLSAALLGEDSLALDAIVNSELTASIDPVIAKMSELIELQVRVAGEDYRNSSEVADTTSRSFYILIAIALLQLSNLLGYFVVQNIYRLVRDLQNSNEKLKLSEEEVAERSNDLLHSKNELTETFERITGGFVALDKNLCFTYVNRNAGKIFDRDPATLIGRPIREEFRDEEAGPFINAYQTSMAEQKYVHFEGYYATYDTWFEIHCYPSPEGLSVHFSDISGRKRIEARLKEQREQLELFVKHSPASLAMFDKEMRYIMTSRRWVNDYNLTGKELIGKSHYEISPHLSQRWKDVINRCLNGAIEKNDEDSYERPDGAIVWVKWEIRPWHKASGEIGGIIIFTDVITDKKEAELKFRNLVEKSLVGVYIIQNEKFAYVNPRFAEIFGYTLNEMTNTFTVDRVVLKDDVTTVRNQIKARIEGQLDSVHYEARGRKKDGEHLWAEMYGSKTLYNGGPAIIGSLLDVTDRKKSEEAIRVSEEKYRYLFQNNPAIIVIWDLVTLKIMEVNDPAVELYGYTREEFKELSVLQYRPADDHQKIKDFAKKMLSSTESKFKGVWRHQKKNGELIYMDISSHRISYNNRIAILSLAKDITEQHKAEEQLKKTYEDIRKLNDHLETIREEERSGIAREIHDELGQQLTALKMDTSWLSKRWNPEDNAVQEKFADMFSLIDDTIKTIRKISSDLRPSLLDDLGLQVALEWQNNEFEKRTGISCRFLSEPNEHTVNKDISIGVFRVYQEVLTNIMRHAKATRVNTNFKVNEDHLVLTVKDNGIGFDLPGTENKNTFGLLGMKERAHMFNGELKIESEKGNGTAVMLKVPLSLSIDNKQA